MLCFFFNDTATTEIYTLSLHDALPISGVAAGFASAYNAPIAAALFVVEIVTGVLVRSEEHTSELQSHSDLVCRLLLEKKKKKIYIFYVHSKTENSRDHMQVQINTDQDD